MTHQAFQVLLSLTDGAKHGYAIIQDVTARTDGEVRLTASTLYDALARMVDQRFIAEVDAPADNADARRRYYELTRTGREAARDHAQRLSRTVDMARAKKLLR
jgi:DNA-binding PadR family transcriptional regulator